MVTNGCQHHCLIMAQFLNQMPLFSFSIKVCRALALGCTLLIILRSVNPGLSILNFLPAPAAREMTHRSRAQLSMKFQSVSVRRASLIPNYSQSIVKGHVILQQYYTIDPSNFLFIIKVRKFLYLKGALQFELVQRIISTCSKF